MALRRRCTRAGDWWFPFFSSLFKYGLQSSLISDLDHLFSPEESGFNGLAFFFLPRLSGSGMKTICISQVVGCDINGFIFRDRHNCRLTGGQILRGSKWLLIWFTVNYIFIMIFQSFVKSPLTQPLRPTRFSSLLVRLFSTRRTWLPAVSYLLFAHLLFRTFVVRLLAFEENMRQFSCNYLVHL